MSKLHSSIKGGRGLQLLHKTGLHLVSWSIFKVYAYRHVLEF